jgi:hypothetical protein
MVMPKAGRKAALTVVKKVGGMAEHSVGYWVV